MAERSRRQLQRRAGGSAVGAKRAHQPVREEAAVPRGGEVGGGGNDAVAAAGGLGSTGVLACSDGRPARRPTGTFELAASESDVLGRRLGGTPSRTGGTPVL